MTRMPPNVEIDRYIAAFAASPVARLGPLAPWALTSQAASLVRRLLTGLSAADYAIDDEVAVHRSAVVEAGAVLKGPLIVGAGGFVAAGAYLRGGNWLDERCCLGPGVELKSSFVFAGTTLAHFNFVGDSLLGSDVNLEAGSIVCNHRNERADKQLRVRLGADLVAIGCDKFGALIGDGARLGANAVVAPGALLMRSAVLARASLCDQERA
jgi:bifunctional N-acetylglucosamine-1-phosphate-uridyltransferase/glucosamine-1-phosphate-acetyltransferase GlmU-like protein